MAHLRPLCVVCGHTGAAGLLLNALLFVPLGAAVARPGDGWRGVLRALAAGALLSLSIETAQLFLAGRHTALGDLIANTAGAGLGGALAVSAGAWLRPSPARAGALSAGWGLAVAAVGLATAALTALSLPPSVWWVQQAPDLGQFERFPGRVIDARSGGLRLAPGPLPPADRRTLASRLLRGPRLEATARFGRPTADLAPVLSVFDGRQREIFVLGQDGRDLVFRLRRRADRFRLHRPAHRAAGLLEGVAAGDTVPLAVRPDAGAPGGAGLCLGAGVARRCGLGFHVGRGWALLAGPDLPAAAARLPGLPGAGTIGRVLDAAWIALLVLPLGWWARPRWGWRLGVLAALGGLAAAPAAGPLLAAGWAEGTGAAAGLLGGAALRAGLQGREQGPDGGG